MLNQDDPGDPMPDLEEMLAMRQKDALCFWVAENLLKHVATDATWRRNCACAGLSTHMTRSDEACGLWVLENSYDRWTDMHKKNNMKSSDIRAKFTNSGGSEKNGRSRKYRGMSDEGVQRFNELVRLVGKDREDNKIWESGFLERMKIQVNEKNSKKRKADSLEESPPVLPLNDFGWDENDAEPDENTPVVCQM